MKRFYLIILSCWMMLAVTSAQELIVKSMSAAGNDISASQYRVNDLNGQPCALVRVQLATSGASFTGNVIGTPQFKLGEYWVYMPAGTKELEVRHNNFVPCHVTFSNYGIKKLESLTTYVLTLLMPQRGTATSVKTQKLTINYSPANATVLIDSKLYRGKGKIEAMLPIGTHNYIIAAEGYESVEGSIKLTVNTPRTVHETLTALADISEQSLDTHHDDESSADSQVKMPKLTLSEMKQHIGSLSKTLSSQPNESAKHYNDSKKTLEDFASAFSNLYQVVLSQTKMSDVEMNYGGRKSRGENHQQIHLDDKTEFIDIHDNGVVNMIEIDPRKVKKTFPHIDKMSWKSSYKEWNEWFTSHGFEAQSYSPYYLKQSMLRYEKGDWSVILMFDGDESKQGTWFSLIISNGTKRH